MNTIKRATYLLMPMALWAGHLAAEDTPLKATTNARAKRPASTIMIEAEPKSILCSEGTNPALEFKRLESFGDFSGREKGSSVFSRIRVRTREVQLPNPYKNLLLFPTNYYF